MFSKSLIFDQNFDFIPKYKDIDPRFFGIFLDWWLYMNPEKTREHPYLSQNIGKGNVLEENCGILLFSLD